MSFFFKITVDGILFSSVTSERNMGCLAERKYRMHSWELPEVIQHSENIVRLHRKQSPGICFNDFIWGADGHQLTVLDQCHLVAEAGADLTAVGRAVARAGSTYLTRTTGNPITRVEVHIDDIADPSA